MPNSEFEPFGESLARTERSDLRPDWASAILMRSGVGLFWTLVLCVVTARAIFYVPGFASKLDTLVAYARLVRAFFV